MRAIRPRYCAMAAEVILHSELTCPHCGHALLAAGAKLRTDPARLDAPRQTATQHKWTRLFATPGVTSVAPPDR
jgi:hypothetical protein